MKRVALHILFWTAYLTQDTNRPLRTVVDPATGSFSETANKQVKEQYDNFLTAFGMQAMLSRYLTKNRYCKNFQIKIQKKMKTSDLTTIIVVNQTPKQAFDAISNVREWWTGDPGSMAANPLHIAILKILVKKQ